MALELGRWRDFANNAAEVVNGVCAMKVAILVIMLPVVYLFADLSVAHSSRGEVHNLSCAFCATWMMSSRDLSGGTTTVERESSRMISSMRGFICICIVAMPESYVSVVVHSRSNIGEGDFYFAELALRAAPWFVSRTAKGEIDRP
jgi:hypothetical protein